MVYNKGINKSSFADKCKIIREKVGTISKEDVQTDFFHMKQQKQLRRQDNRIAHFKHQFKKPIVLSCHRCLINSGVEKINYI